jgi:FG-GAP repeat
VAQHVDRAERHLVHRRHPVAASRLGLLDRTHCNGGDWSIVATGDFNGDGKGDIVWRNTSGTTAIWLMNGSTLLKRVALG